MKTITQLNKWANAHTNYGTDALRVFLGAFLFIKGIDFINQTESLVQIISPIDTYGSSMLLVHYIALGHMLGGLLIMLGFLTRLSIIVQLPILLGAVIINFVGDMIPGNLWQAIIALLAAVFFLFYGSGKHSLDYNFKLEM
ncbi:MAG: DoxX family protein [Schleiferiaceae bacterium]|jgi:uncharacterized membrane protein YphA (DoxX/SURF4 family)|nr:DoxX family protein [Schleiferiaceae bacterium]